MKIIKIIFILIVLLLIAGCEKEVAIMKDKPAIEKISIFEENDESGVLFPEDAVYTGDLFDAEMVRPSEMIEK